MQKTVVCVFAHPDDEAFGPSGTIAKLAKKNDIYILCATKGQAGKDSSLGNTSLGEKRAEELKQSAKILGVKKVFFLGFKDGTLCNNIYHKLAGKIQKKLEELKPETVLTFEPHGISGHIDHIMVSFVTTYVFYKTSFSKELWYYCISERERNSFEDDYFIYFPPGYDRREIDKIVDISDVWDVKVKAMKTHESQKHDAKRILEILEKQPKEEYFLVVNK